MHLSMHNGASIRPRAIRKTNYQLSTVVFSLLSMDADLERNPSLFGRMSTYVLGLMTFTFRPRSLTIHMSGRL